MSNKRKILLLGENPAACSGFGKYNKEVMTRLYNSNKFELAELSCYSTIEDQRLYNIPWKLYCNAVKSGDNRFAEYNRNPVNNFGNWRLEKTLLDFRPDILIGYRDFWMDSYIFDSPLRPYFHFVWMPTCDSSPIKQEWVSNICDADAIFAYNDWSLEVMKVETNNKANIIRSAFPGIDPDIFSPASNKTEQKKKMMFPPDINLIGMVARNQKRKLFPDLFVAFNKFLNICYKLGHDDLAQKTFLFLHTSYPDAGWDIPLLLKEQNISHKVFFSYICKDCKKWFPSLFSDARTVCPFCGNLSAVLPNVELGINEQELAEIYKCFDIYTQIMIAAGAEMPIIEAAACGVYCMASDNTAVIDIIRKVNGEPLKIAHTFRELETGAYRHYTDIDNLAHRWHIYLSAIKAFPKEKEKRENNTRESTLKYFTWDRTAKIWEDYLENCLLTGTQGKWNSPPKIIYPRINKSFEKMSNLEFVEYLFCDIIQKPEKFYKYEGQNLLSILNYGAEINGRRVIYINRQDIHNKFINLVNMYNQCEEIRCGIRQLPKEDFIEHANLRTK